MKQKHNEKHFSNPMGGAAIQIHVNPDAKKNCIRNISETGLISVDLEKGKDGNGSINTLLVNYLSKELKVSPKQIEIIDGDNGDKKLICLLDIPVEIINKRLSRYT